MGEENQSYRSVAYFVNWAIYARKHRPQDLIAENLTHVLYAFANVRPESGEVYMTDSWADTDIHWEGDSWNDTGKNLYGCLKQLNLLKKRNRNLKVLLSIGGWTYSSNFKQPASTPEGRDKFASSSLQLLKTLGFDGLDIDWEYPEDESQAGHLVELLATVRKHLDEYGEKMGDKKRFALTVACPAGPEKFKRLDMSGMDKHLDFWNLMGYDYAGSWDKVSAHQANLYPSKDNAASTPFSTMAAIDYYTKHGVASEKIVLGMPLYGRAFEGTAGPGQAYQDIGDGDWERGIFDYKNLPLKGASEEYDEQAGASWCYNKEKQKFVTYDTPHMTKIKAEFVKKHRLGGVMWWESSADKGGKDSLIATAVEKLGGKDSLQKQENCVDYPETPYDNLKNGFPNA